MIAIKILMGTNITLMILLLFVMWLVVIMLFRFAG